MMGKKSDENSRALALNETVGENCFLARTTPRPVKTLFFFIFQTLYSMWNNTTDLTERLPQWMMTSFGIYLSTAVIIGSIANGTALFVFFSNKHLRSPTNVFIIGLLTSDFLMCTVATPFPAISNFAGRWLFGWSGCVFHGFAAYVLGLSNLYILSAIAVDRYIVIAKPLQAANINFRVANLSVCMCYLFGLLWSSVPFFGWSSYVFEGAGLSCAISYEYTDPYAFSYSIAIFINCYLIPIFVMLYSYYFVYMTVSYVFVSDIFALFVYNPYFFLVHITCSYSWYYRLAYISQNCLT